MYRPLAGEPFGAASASEPGVPAGRVVRDDVDDDLDPPGVQPRGHLVEVGQRAEPRVHVAVVVDVVPAVGQRRRVERAEPDRVDAQVGQVRDPGDDALEIA